MASSVVDRKFLGTLAKEVEQENPLLSSTLFKILGLSDRLSGLLVTARKQRRLGPQKAAESQHLHHRILWLAREGLVMLEQYVLPMVTNSNQLKVLAYKLRASLYHIIVLFHNKPPVHAVFQPNSEPAPLRVDKGKGIARGDDESEAEQASPYWGQYEGGPVAPPPGFGTEVGAAFLLPVGDYLPQAMKCFKDAEDLADRTLWGSHSLRLSIKTEFSAFLFECVHDEEGSRKLARKTINEVYEATEGIDNDMFQDACELVTVLGKMMKRGLAPSTRSKGSSPSTTVRGAQPEITPARSTAANQTLAPALSTGPSAAAHTVMPQQAAQPPPVAAAAAPPPASEAQPGFI